MSFLVFLTFSLSSLAPSLSLLYTSTLFTLLSLPAALFPFALFLGPLLHTLLPSRLVFLLYIFFLPFAFFASCYSTFRPSFPSCTFSFSSFPLFRFFFSSLYSPLCMNALLLRPSDDSCDPIPALASEIYSVFGPCAFFLPSFTSTPDEAFTGEILRLS